MKVRSGLEPFDVIEGLLASMAHACFVMSHGRRAVMVSEAFCRLSGYTAEEFLALESTTVLSTKGDLVGSTKALNGALAGKSPRMRRRVIVTQGGEHVSVKGTAMPLPPKAGATLVLVEVWPDEERLVRSEEELPPRETGWPHLVERLDGLVAQRHELLDALLGSLSHACIAVCEGRSAILATQALLDLSGYSLDELLGVSVKMVLSPPDQLDVTRKAVHSVLAGGPSTRRSPRDIIRADGTRNPGETSITPMHVRGLSNSILAEFWPLSEEETTDKSAA